jgi:predicted nucleotidyltransferase
MQGTIGKVMASLKNQLLQQLAERKAEISERFDVKSLAVFGSVVHDTANVNSDIDILVEYYNAPGLFRFFDLKQYLEKLTGREVDLVTKKALKKQLRDKILSEAIHVS